MKINSIRVQNFRCFEQLDVSFHPQLTVIVGKNSSGKSAILDAVAIAVGAFLLYFEGTDSYGIKKTDARLITHELGDSIETYPVYPVSISSVGEIDGNEIAWERILNSANGRGTNASAKEITAITKAYQKRIINGDAQLVLPIIAYYGTGRLWAQHREKKEDVLLKTSRLNGYIDCLDKAANNKLIMNWFEKEASKKLQKKRGTSSFDAVVTAIKKCISLLFGDEDVSVYYDFDIKDLDIQYRSNGSDVVIPLSRMSDGCKCAISLITDIAYRMAQLNPQLREDVLTAPGVVIIDEIDLHLHPEWQKRVLGDLTNIFPNVQFIVSSHSPSIISSARSENLLILEDNTVNEPMGEVHGKDVSTIISGVMRSTERSDDVQSLFVEFYSALDKNDMEGAKKIISEIEDLTGGSDAELSACYTKLKLSEIRLGIKHDCNKKEYCPG